MQPSFFLSGLLSVYIRYGIQCTIPLFQQYYLNIVYSIMKNVAWQWLDSWPEADCMIGFIIVYILIIPTQAAWAYNKRKRENIISQNQLFFLKLGKLLIKDMFSNKKNWLRSVNSQSMKKRYKNIAGLTCYIQLNSKQTKRPPHLLHCRRNEVP